MNIKGKMREKSGITLITLVITIIVLLILAGVTIATLTGENGILTRASEASKQTEIASVKEQAQLDVTNWVAEELENGREGTISDWEDIKNILDEANPNTENRYYVDVTEEGIETPNGYIVPIEEFYTSNTDEGETSETIGEAINIEKYGYIVPEYTVKTSEMSTNVWKLFYQDNNYTYLITDEVVGEYKPSDYYTTIENEADELKYQTGADVSIIGQKLNPKLLEAGTFFVEGNTSISMRATAWLTDTSETSMWNEYKNPDAVFAIGSPTIELYVASFNATAVSLNSASQITLELDAYGYDPDASSGQLKTSYNYGIYNNNSSWWLASPMYSGPAYGIAVYSGLSSFSVNSIPYTSYGVRPIACIPTSVFNEKYTLVEP